MLELFRKQGPEPIEQKASASAKVMAMAGSGRVAWSPRDAVSLTRNGFQGNPVGFRCVRLISEAAAAVPVLCQDAERRYDYHPLLTLLSRPNAGQTRAEMTEALIAQLMLSGNAYLEAVLPEEGGLPLELHVLRSDRMNLVPGSDGWAEAYDYTVGNKKHRFAADQICHFRTFHPSDDHYGLAPLQAAATALDVHNAASRWSKALLDNAARPSGAIVYKGVDGAGGLTEDQFLRLQAEMESHHTGARNAGRPMLLDGGLDWKPMGFSPSDMEFQKTKEAAAREIALAFGVPPMLLGIPGDATYANYAEANRAFYRLTVLPLISRVLATMAHWLGGFTVDPAELRPDIDQLPALSVERDAQWKRVAEADFLTQAEKRAMLGLPPMADDA